MKGQMPPTHEKADADHSGEMELPKLMSGGRLPCCAACAPDAGGWPATPLSPARHDGDNPWEVWKAD